MKEVSSADTGTLREIPLLILCGILGTFHNILLYGQTIIDILDCPIKFVWISMHMKCVAMLFGCV